MVMSQRVIERIRNLCFHVFCVGSHLAVTVLPDVLFFRQIWLFFYLVGG